MKTKVIIQYIGNGWEVRNEKGDFLNSAPFDNADDLINFINENNYHVTNPECFGRNKEFN